MVVSFTGAQSTGKSTLFERIKADDRFRRFNFVRELTRTLKKDYNLKINEEGDDITQLAILNGHFLNYLKYKNSNALMDRCILDGLVYTTYLYNKGKVSREIAEYAEFITNKILSGVDIIFYTEPDIPIEDDGERSIDKDFRETIVNLFEAAFEHYNLKVIRLNGSVDNRLTTIYKEFDNYGK
jgi:nicotinamide riboside kinase